MYTITGEVINTFDVKPTDKFPDPSFKVQLLGETYTQDGQIRKEMVTLSVPKEVYFDLQKQAGASVSLPVALFANKVGQIFPFYPKGKGVQKPSMTTRERGAEEEEKGAF